MPPKTFSKLDIFLFRIQGAIFVGFFYCTPSDASDPCEKENIAKRSCYLFVWDSCEKREGNIAKLSCNLFVWVQ
jgi:hypothetical protein